MKATIAGIPVEGTPEEIYQIHELMKVKTDIGVNVAVNEEHKQDVNELYIKRYGMK